MERSNPYFWPNDIELLLIRSAIGKNQQKVLRSFEQWTDHHGFTPAQLIKGQVLPHVYDSLEDGSRKLLPLVYSNFRKLGIEHPIVDQFVSYHRYTTYKNRMLQSQADHVLEQLTKQRIPYYIRKGLAYVSLYYDDYGARPTSDIDIVIGREHIHSFLEARESEGWTSLINWRMNSIYDSLHHAITLKKHHFEMDIHWRFGHYPLSEKQNQQLFQVGINHNSMTVLPHEYNLIDTAVHGYIYNRVRPIRWVCDAVKIIEGNPDWSLVEHIAEKCEVSIPLSHAFEFLKNEELADIPEKTLANVASITAQKKVSYYYKLVSTDVTGLNGYSLILFNAKAISTNPFKVIWKSIKHYRLAWNQPSVIHVFAVGFLIALEKLFFKNKILFMKKVRSIG